MTEQPAAPTMGAIPVTAVRSAMLATAVIGIVLGIVMLFLPGVTLVTIAVLFGIALIVAGIYRIVFGLTSKIQSSMRWLLVILGALTVIAGVLCLIHPGSALVFVAIMIGIAWIFDGVHDVLNGILGTTVGPRWLSLVGGVLGVIAGIIVMTMPGMALTTFVTVGAILLIIVSIVTLLTLPPKTPAA